MLPYFKPDDRVFTFNWARVKKGDVIVFARGSKKYLKRVYKIEADLVYVSGDNKKESSKYAPFKKNKIVGKVIFKF